MGRSIDRRPPAGMVDAWTFNHGDTRGVGSVGGSGTLRNGASISGTDLRLDGTNDFMDVPHDDAYSFTDGDDLPFSICGWIYMDTHSTNDILMCKWQNSPRKGEWIIGYSHSLTRLFFWTYNSTATRGYGANVSTTLNTGEWYHLAGCYDGSRNWTGYKVYLNGVSQTTALGGYGAVSPTMSNTGIPVNIGALDDLAGYSVDGDLSTIELYNRQLTATEVAIIYQQGRR